MGNTGDYYFTMNYNCGAVTPFNYMKKAFHLLTRTMLKIVTRERACDIVTCVEYGDNKATDQSSR